MAPAPAATVGEAPAAQGRRTVTITGRGDDRPLRSQFDRPRPQRRRHERPGYRPDRWGLWAVLLCVVLLLVAATSSRGATLTPNRSRPVARTVTVAAPAHPLARVHR